MMLKKITNQIGIACLLLFVAGFGAVLIPAARAQYAGGSLFARAASGGEANAQTIILANVLSLSDLRGETVKWIVGANLTNTTAATLNINGFGAVPIERMNSGTLMALGGGEMPAGKMIRATYDGSELILLTDYTGGAPAFKVGYFYRSSCPPGWSATNGSGNTVNTVGMFIRSLNTGSSGFDPNRTLGSSQSNSVQALGWTGTTSITFNSGQSNAYLGSTNSPAGSDPGPSLSGNIYELTSSMFSASTTGSVTGTGTETRPQNVALLACQKN